MSRNCPQKIAVRAAPKTYERSPVPLLDRGAIRTVDSLDDILDLLPAEVRSGVRQWWAEGASL